MEAGAILSAVIFGKPDIETKSQPEENTRNGGWTPTLNIDERYSGGGGVAVN
jgi:hypothetical protein